MIFKITYQCHIRLLTCYQYFMICHDLISHRLTSDMSIKLIRVIKCDLDDLSDLGDMGDLCDLSDLSDSLNYIKVALIS